MSDLTDMVSECIYTSGYKPDGKVVIDKIEALEAERDALRAENERYKAALESIANADSSNVRSPLGALHAAGIVFQWKIDAKKCRAALAAQEAQR